MKKKFFNLSTIVLICVLIFCSNILEISLVLNNLLYSYTSKIKNVVVPPNNNVLLVRNSMHVAKDEWEKIVSFVTKLKVRALVFCKETNLEEQTYLQQVQFQSIFFAVNTTDSPSELPTNTGILTNPIAMQGQYHKHLYNQGKYAAIETIVAESLLMKKMPQGDYLIDFAEPFSLPNIEFQSFLEEEIIEELVKDKVLVFGYDPAHVYTPVGNMSLLEYRGNAINTLLNKRFLKELSSEQKIVLLILIFFAFSSLLHRFGHTAPILFTFFIIILYTILVISCEIFFYLRLPYMDVVLLQLVLLVLFLHRRMLFSRNFGQGLVNKLKDIQGHSKEDFKISAEVWPKIIRMTTMVFRANRTIFIEKPKDTYQLREVASFNFSLKDIHPEYHKCSQILYRSSVEEGKFIHVPQGFLLFPLPQENLYLIPLIFLNEVLGFWIVGIDKEQENDMLKFDLLLEEYGKYISELFYVQKNKTTLFHDRLLPIEKYHQELKNSLDRTEQHILNLESLFSNRYCGSIVYNVFGDIILCNRKAEQIFESKKIVPYKTSLLETISVFLDCEELQAQTILHSVILDHQKISVPIVDNNDRRFTFNLWPLQSKKESPFSSFATINGIVCEFIEETLFSKLSEIQETILEKIGLTLRNELTALSLSVSLLESSPGQISMLADIINQKIDDITDVVNSCEEFIKLDHFAYNNNAIFPINPKPFLDKVQRSLVQELQQKNVTILTQQPKLLPVVFASFHLEKVFYSIFKLLSKDAKDNSTIHLDIKTQTGLIEYYFYNEGFGMPSENFQECLYGDKELESYEFLNIRECIEVVKDWGAQLEANSKIGEGISVKLSLAASF